jgi:hypothetical protein
MKRLENKLPKGIIRLNVKYIMLLLVLDLYILVTSVKIERLISIFNYNTFANYIESELPTDRSQRQSISPHSKISHKKLPFSIFPLPCVA